MERRAQFPSNELYSLAHLFLTPLGILYELWNGRPQ